MLWSIYRLEDEGAASGVGEEGDGWNDTTIGSKEIVEVDLQALAEALIFHVIEGLTAHVKELYSFSRSEERGKEHL